MYIKIENGEPTGYPITDENLRLLVPSNVSLPPYPVTADVLPLGFAVYEFTPAPTPAPAELKVVSEGNPVWTSDELRGDYVTQVWNVRDMTPDEVEVATNNQWDLVRAERNWKLTSSDWTQLPDAPVDAAIWASYRQELRDVTKQADPFAIIWPEVPGA